MYIALLDKIRGIDSKTWPEARATITNIEQPYTRRFEFLSRITFSFRDSKGEYYAGKFELPTSDMPEDWTEGTEVAIHYFPKNPNRTWYEGDYWRAREADAADFQFVMIGIVLLFVAFAVIAWVRSLMR